jgi:oxygen-dependent protoporphyrinogen oxidase
MEPFVAGTLAADPDRTCAAAALPRLAELERRYGSLTAGVLMHRVLRRRSASSTEVFSFRGGMATLVEGLAAAPGIAVHTGHRIDEVARERGGWRVTAQTPQGPRTLRASQLILATPAPAAATLLADLDAELAALLRGIDYAPLALVHAGFAREDVGHALDGTGFLAPRRESAVLTGNLWMSTLFPDRAPPGKALLSSYLGGARAPQVADWDDRRIADEALRTLRPLLGLRGDPQMLQVDRHAQALPLYHGAYAARMQAVADRLREHPGLHLEANYRGGVSVRDRLVCGQAVAARILAARPSPSAARGLPPPGSPCPAGSY